MDDKNKFKDRERALEDEYFSKKEHELIEKMRNKLAREADRKQIAEETGVTDQDILDALQSLGYNSETISILYMVPLVQIAWAEGYVAEKEREMVLEIARARDIIPGTEAYEKLCELLKEEPPEDFFENSLRAIRYMIKALPDDHRAASQESLVEMCTMIADVTGGILGFGNISDEERILIARIATEISQGRESLIQNMIKK
ncbi:MAG: hypothetical protein IPO77_06130 [Acidobacteria bacterium]|nr:hypothetical protein [Acidobacteriota bacterium]